MGEPLKAVEAEAGTTPKGSQVTLVTESAEVSLLVPPPGKWRTTANRALRQGDFDEWAQMVLSAEDFDAWNGAEPTNDDVQAFFEAWREVTGEDQGKSRASRRSSKGTARQ